VEIEMKLRLETVWIRRTSVSGASRRRRLTLARTALTEGKCDPIATLLRQTNKVDFGTLSVDGNGLI
jgi:hypothetical protein